LATSLSLLSTPFEDDFSVKLYITHIIPFPLMDVVEDLSGGEVAIEGEIPGNASLDHIIDQLDTKLRVSLELLGPVVVFLLKSPPLDGVVRSKRGDIVGDEVVVRDLVALFGMIPQPAHILDELSGMTHQNVVDGDHSFWVVPCGLIILKYLKPSVIEGMNIPLDIREPAIEAGLVRSTDKLMADPANGLLFRDHESRKIIGKMTLFRLIDKQITKLLHGFPDDRGILDNCRHEGILLSQNNVSNAYHNASECFTKSPSTVFRTLTDGMPEHSGTNLQRRRKYICTQSQQ